MNWKKMKCNTRSSGLLHGLILSVILQCVTALLYRIPYQHAAAGDPAVYSIKISAIDDMIPVVPFFFLGYIWAYVYWFLAPFYILRTGKRKTQDFIFTYLTVLILCSLILYIFPTKIDRVAEGLLNPSNSGFFWKLLHICYHVDGGNVSYDLLPSMHCANCVLYYQALRDDPIPHTIQKAALVSTILVIASTLLTKQHFFLDAVTGVMIPLAVRPAVLRIAQLLRKVAEREAPGVK